MEVPILFLWAWGFFRMTIYVASLLRGDLGHGHRLFLAQLLYLHLELFGLQGARRRGRSLRGGGVYMSKDGSIWQLFVLCLLELGNTVPKCYVLLEFGAPLKRIKLPNGLLPAPAF